MTDYNNDEIIFTMIEHYDLCDRDKIEKIARQFIEFRMKMLGVATQDPIINIYLIYLLIYYCLKSIPYIQRNVTNSKNLKYFISKTKCDFSPLFYQKAKKLIEANGHLLTERVDNFEVNELYDLIISNYNNGKSRLFTMVDIIKEEFGSFNILGGGAPFTEEPGDIHKVKNVGRGKYGNIYMSKTNPDMVYKVINITDKMDDASLVTQEKHIYDNYKENSIGPNISNTWWDKKKKTYGYSLPKYTSDLYDFLLTAYINQATLLIIEKDTFNLIKEMLKNDKVEYICFDQKYQNILIQKKKDGEYDVVLNDFDTTFCKKKRELEEFVDAKLTTTDTEPDIFNKLLHYLIFFHFWLLTCKINKRRATNYYTNKNYKNSSTFYIHFLCNKCFDLNNSKEISYEDTIICIKKFNRTLRDAVINQINSFSILTNTLKTDINNMDVLHTTLWNTLTTKNKKILSENNWLAMKEQFQSIIDNNNFNFNEITKLKNDLNKFSRTIVALQYESVDIAICVKIATIIHSLSQNVLTYFTRYNAKKKVINGIYELKRNINSLFSELNHSSPAPVDTGYAMIYNIWDEKYIELTKLYFDIDRK